MREKPPATCASSSPPQSATLEESHRDGRRYTLITEHQRLPIRAALGVKLEREGRIRPLCRLSGKTLWVASV